MVTTRPPKTIVKPTALGPVANTDTKLLIYGLFQKGRVLAQDGVPGVQFSSATNVQFTAAANSSLRSSSTCLVVKTSILLRTSHWEQWSRICFLSPEQQVSELK